MTQPPRKRAPGGGRPRTVNGVKIAVTLGAQDVAYLATLGSNRSAALRRVIQEHREHAAPKFIDRAQALGEYVCTAGGDIAHFTITPTLYSDKAYNLTWFVRLKSGKLREFNVIVTDDGKSEPFAVNDDVDMIVRTMQRTIAQWEYEELVRR